MKIETYQKRGYQIIRINEEWDVISDLSELRDLVVGYLARGRKFLAVSFSDASYIYSGALKVLINCHKRVVEQEGSLSIIEPNPKLLNVLDALAINRVIHIYVSEDFLPDKS
jgi:anti-anti-sigma factor